MTIAVTPARVISDVVAAIFANPYQRIWGGAGEPALPVYEVTFTSVFGGLIFGATRQFLTDSERTLDSGADLRWGKDRKGFPRLVHPNGICLTGRWQITEDTPYSGYFRKDSTALIVARYSTCCTETRRGRTRSLSMVGKLFPTTDPHDTRPLRTANFMTQEDIGGANRLHQRRRPQERSRHHCLASRRVGVRAADTVGMTFGKVDRGRHASASSIKSPSSGSRRANRHGRPQFMRLHVSPRQPKIEGADLDFRDEIMAQIFDRGDPVPEADADIRHRGHRRGETSGPAVRLRRTFQELEEDRRAGVRQCRRARTTATG